MIGLTRRNSPRHFSSLTLAKAGVMTKWRPSIGFIVMRSTRMTSPTSAGTPMSSRSTAQSVEATNASISDLRALVLGASMTTSLQSVAR